MSRVERAPRIESDRPTWRRSFFVKSQEKKKIENPVGADRSVFEPNERVD